MNEWINDWMNKLINEWMNEWILVEPLDCSQLL